MLPFLKTKLSGAANNVMTYTNSFKSKEWDELIAAISFEEGAEETVKDLLARNVEKVKDSDSKFYFGFNPFSKLLDINEIDPIKKISALQLSIERANPRIIGLLILYQIRISIVNANAGLLIPNNNILLDGLNDAQKKALFLGLSLAIEASPWKHSNYTQVNRFSCHYRVITPEIPAELGVFVRQLQILNSFSPAEKRSLLIAAVIKNDVDLISALALADCGIALNGRYDAQIISYSSFEEGYSNTFTTLSRNGSPSLPTALHHAVLNRAYDAAKKLVELGASVHFQVNLMEDRGVLETPIALAARLKDLKMVQGFLDVDERLSNAQNKYTQKELEAAQKATPEPENDEDKKHILEIKRILNQYIEKKFPKFSDRNPTLTPVQQEFVSEMSEPNAGGIFLKALIAKKSLRGVEMQDLSQNTAVAESSTTTISSSSKKENDNSPVGTTDSVIKVETVTQKSVSAAPEPLPEQKITNSADFSKGDAPDKKERRRETAVCN